jgi:hypothetical protein
VINTVVVPEALPGISVAYIKKLKKRKVINSYEAVFHFNHF